MPDYILCAAASGDYGYQNHLSPESSQDLVATFQTWAEIPIVNDTIWAMGITSFALGFVPGCSLASILLGIPGGIVTTVEIYDKCRKWLVEKCRR